MDVKQSYEYFLIALKDYVSREGHGAKSYVGNNIGTSGSFIGQILKKGASKKASLKTQIAIAEFLSESYEAFLLTGKALSIAEESTAAPGNGSIIQTNTETTKNVSAIVGEDTKMMFQRYDTMIESLEQEKKDLRADLEREQQAHDRITANLHANLAIERQEHKDAMVELHEDYRALKAEYTEFKLECKQLLERFRALNLQKTQPCLSPDKPEGKRSVKPLAV